MTATRLALACCAVAALVPLAACNHTASLKQDAAQPETVMAVTAASVRVAPISRRLDLLGTTVALRHISLRAPAAGRVMGFRLQSGERVRSGEVVAYVLNRETEAAENGLAVARRIDRSEAPALARSISRYTREKGIAVTAPQAAIVSQPLVSSGQMVSDLQPLADLIDPASIYIQAAVPAQDVGLVRPGMKATITSPIAPDIDFPGRVAALSPNFTQASASAAVRVDFSGEQRISQAGAPVEVAVTTRHVPDAIVIPAAALFEDASNDRFYVFVAGKDGKAHRTPIRLGIRLPNEVQVASGLAPGQLVITSGGYALSDGLAVKATVTGN